MKQLFAFFCLGVVKAPLNLFSLIQSAFQHYRHLPGVAEGRRGRGKAEVCPLPPRSITLASWLGKWNLILVINDTLITQITKLCYIFTTALIILRHLIPLAHFWKGWSRLEAPVPHVVFSIPSPQIHWGITFRSSLLFGFWGSPPKDPDQDGSLAHLGWCPLSPSLPLEFPQN